MQCASTCPVITYNSLFHEQHGHLKMLGGYLEFFMNPTLATTYVRLKRELYELVHEKVCNICTMTILFFRFSELIEYIIIDENSFT